MDVKWIILGFNIFAYVTGIVGFCIIKFNDFRHIENDVEKLEKRQEDYEIKQNDRHEANVKSINNLAVKVGELTGKLEGK